MARFKRKLSAAERRARKKRQQEFMTIFVHGKKKRVRRPPKIDGMDIDEFALSDDEPF